jgi:hypothetical protein
MNYTWHITQMDCYPQAEGQVNVVWNAVWKLSATDGITTCYITGNQALTYVAGSSYTPYAQLTETQVVGWVQSAMGADAVTANEKIVNDLVVETVVPATYQPPLPWAGA